jgi:hypothetical protein
MAFILVAGRITFDRLHMFAMRAFTSKIIHPSHALQLPVERAASS